jgi:hypothetical protein
MSRLRLAPTTFMIAYCCVYIFVLAMNLPLFMYYPLHGDFAWGWQGLKGAGPAMAWYGLMANAAIVAVVVAVCVPNRLPDRALRNCLWLVPVAAIVACTFLMRGFFV